MKTKDLVGIGLLAVGGFLLYTYIKNKPKGVEQPTDGTGGTGTGTGTGGTGTGTGGTGTGIGGLGVSPDAEGNCPEGTSKLVINCIAAPCPPTTCVPIGKDVLDRPADFGDRWKGTRDPFVIPDLANPFVNPSDINTPQVDDFGRAIPEYQGYNDIVTDSYVDILYNTATRGTSGIDRLQMV